MHLRRCWVTLVGMSGTGKTHLSRHLHDEYDFAHFCIDQMIEELLREEEGPVFKTSVAEWMGFPDAKHYSDRSKRYLELEEKCVRDVLQVAENPQFARPERAVVDTTGSVVYLDETVLQRLRQVTTIVHLETPADVRDKMYDDFLSNPTPLIWDGVHRKNHESTQEALKRSYRTLINDREAMYKRLSEHTLRWEVRRRAGFEPFAFLEEVGVVC